MLVLDITLASLRKGSLVTCVSECWYQLSWVHYIFLVNVAMTMMIPMLCLTPENFKFLSFFACGALVFVATAPSYLEYFEGKVHSVSAIICAVFAVAWAVVVVPVALAGCVFAIPAMFDKVHRLLWFELCAFASAYIGVILLD